MKLNHWQWECRFIIITPLNGAHQDIHLRALNNTRGSSSEPEEENATQLEVRYRMIKMSLRTWWLQHKNTQKYFKQFRSLTMIMYLESVISDGVSVSLVSPWPCRSAVKQIEPSRRGKKDLCCNHQGTEAFLSPCTWMTDLHFDKNISTPKVNDWSQRGAT
jgi:hypothetical protein